MICASPDYLATHGAPQTPAELAQHNCLCYARGPRRIFWQFRNDAGTQEQEVTERCARTTPKPWSRPPWVAPASCCCRPGSGAPEQRTAASGASDYRYGRTGQHFAGGDIFAVYLTNRSGSAKVKSFIDAPIAHIGPEPYWDI